MTEQDFLEGQIILIDKPIGWTSFQAVNKIKRAILKKYGLNKIKIGHAGTLDPLASGLLIVCTGKKTKIIQQIQDSKKQYTGEITLGATTPSYDMETEIDCRYPTSHIKKDTLLRAARDLTGEITQYPPVFSAIKKNGKRLYSYARDGQQVEVEPRQVTIYEFEIDQDGFPLSEKILFKVVCSKGTYIRSLANDFGQLLISGAYLSQLRRTKVGDYSVSDALSPEQYIKTFLDEKE